VVTDTIPLKQNALSCKKIQVLSISDLMGEAIIRSYRGDSVTSLFV
jgi:ribose-phosphate pyrophosphokinase